MAGALSVLLLDDGELDRVQAILDELEVEHLRLKGREIGRWVEAPTDLLITSGKRTLNKMPRLERAEGAPEPIWMCLHNQDFLPLRERLREMGVHFLVQGALDQESLRLFVTQLLYHGAERRSHLRLPLGGEVDYVIGEERFKARLAELSPEICRLTTSQEIALETEVAVVLPAALSGGEPLELSGRVVHCAELERRAGDPVFTSVVRFEQVDAMAKNLLEGLVTGAQIGTRLTPLAELPRRPSANGAVAEAGDAAAEPPSEPADSPERRRLPRHQYLRNVQAFTAGTGSQPLVTIGRDLSVEGVRIEPRPEIALGMRVSLALYGGPREEPVVVEARVVRDDGPRGLGLQFEGLTRDQRGALQKLASALPPLRSLGQDETESEGLVVSRVVPKDQ